MSGLEVGLLTEPDWATYQQVRLAMLAESPGAFGSRYADAVLLPEDHWRQRLRDNGVYLARLDRRPVGSATYSEAGAEQPGDAHLLAMWVDPQARGHRVGTALVRAVQQHTRRAGRGRLLLTVVDDNEAAAQLYRSCGFAPTGRTKPYPNDARRSELELLWTAGPVSPEGGTG